MRVHYNGATDGPPDWRHRGSYIAKHGLTPALANEAVNDPNRLVLDPDPSSQSGRTIRIVGWSSNREMLITVILLPDGEVTWGVNAWPSNGTDQRRYREEEVDED
ncbi:hypothetical protein [Arsenicicoccus bolidensis]|jgi:hypothetical protein|uniref:hypothetical protein n=1 Tax=Arsenicicoccus bolidensis TaxID=229480 RepID=UPI000685B50F|nr:hypothetical protein [Arsenicicoccus bolidensis]